MEMSYEIADLLLSDANPSGKPCTSYPAVDDKTPLFYNNYHTGPDKLSILLVMVSPTQPMPIPT
jgi:hypothetical protein